MKTSMFAAAALAVGLLGATAFGGQAGADEKAPVTFKVKADGARVPPFTTLITVTVPEVSVAANANEAETARTAAALKATASDFFIL